MMGQLFMRPGKVAYEYIVEGKRKRYFPPFQYLIILGAIATIIVVNSHFIEHTYKTMGGFAGNASQQSAQQAAFMRQMSLWQSKYYNILILLQLPFYALSALVFYKRKYRYNYAELLTLQTFVSAQYTIISMVLMLTVFFTKSGVGYLNTAMMLISIAYHSWVYMEFFNEKNLVGFLKALGSAILGILFFVLFTMIITIVILIVMYLTK